MKDHKPHCPKGMKPIKGRSLDEYSCTCSIPVEKHRK